MRETARAEGRSIRYDGRWRDRDPAEAPAGVAPVIRIKAPLEGEMTIHDAVQGSVTVPHPQLDDMILHGVVDRHLALERGDRKSTRLNSSHSCAHRMPSSA